MFINIQNSSQEYLFAGLFGFVGAEPNFSTGSLENIIVNDEIKASISNVKVDNGYVGVTAEEAQGNKSSCSAGIAAYPNCTRIDNCSNNVTVSSNSDKIGTMVGGIAAWAPVSIINNCSNSGALSANAKENIFIGGIVGQLYWAGMANNNTNSGSINVKSEYNNCSAGGIVGYVYATSNFEVNNNTNSGPINTECIRKDSQVIYHVGGIVGTVMCDLGNSGLVRTIAGSTNNGPIDVKASDLVPMTGGIVGLTTDGVTIERCSNSGAISTISAKRLYTGGIVGNMEDAAGRMTIVNSCENTGAINVVNSSSDDSDQVCVGGLVGTNVNAMISHSNNLGAVSVSRTTGAGRVLTGGLVGHNVGARVKGAVGTKYSYSAAPISATGGKNSVAAGVVGSYEQERTVLTENYYDSSISGVSGGSMTVNNDKEVIVDKEGAAMGKPTAEMQGVALRTGATGEGWTDENWIFGDGEYPRVNWGDPTFEIPMGLTGEYGKPLSTVEIPAAANGTWTWVNPDELIVGGIGETHEYDAIFTPADRKYRNVQAKIPVTVIAIPMGDEVRPEIINGFVVMLILSGGLMFILSKRQKSL